MTFTIGRGNDIVSLSSFAIRCAIRSNLLRRERDERTEPVVMVVIPIHRFVKRSRKSPIAS